MDAWQLDYFEDLVRMETIKTQSDSVPLDQLINMTYNLEECQVLQRVQTDEQLGRFYVESGFMPELDGLPESTIELLDYKMGRQSWESEKEVFISNDYVVSRNFINIII